MPNRNRIGEIVKSGIDGRSGWLSRSGEECETSMAMKKTSLFLAAIFLCLGTNQSRAGEVFSYFKKANSTAVESQPALQKPSQPVPGEETLPAPREVAPAPAEKHAPPEQAAPVVESAPAQGQAADCGGCNAHD